MFARRAHDAISYIVQIALGWYWTAGKHCLGPSLLMPDVTFDAPTGNATAALCTNPDPAACRVHAMTDLFGELPGSALKCQVVFLDLVQRLWR